MSRTPEQEFYAHNDAYTKPKPEPGLDPRLNELLGEIGGKCPFGDNRYQIVFAGNLMKEGRRRLPDGSIADGQVIKYLHKFTKDFCWRFKGLDGEYHEVSSANQLPPQTEIDGFPVAVPTIYQLGKLRFVLEVKFTLEELVLLGKYPHPESTEAKCYGLEDDGEFIDKYPSPRGLYEGRLIFEDKAGEFLRPTRDWLENVFRPHFWEGQNYGMDELKKLDAERLAADEKNTEQAVRNRNMATGDQLMTDISRRPDERVIFLPNFN